MNQAFAMKNLSGQSVERCEPWKWAGRDRVPERAFQDKSARDAWATNPNTDYQMYSFYEGLNCSIRVSEKNPPAKLHAIPVDYDLGISMEEMEHSLARLDRKPNWIERTLSGYWRFIYFLEKPFMFASIPHQAYLMDQIDSLIPVNEIAGLDKGALTTYSRYFTNGGIWKFIHDKPLSAAECAGWEQKASVKFNWVTGVDGTAVELTRAMERCKEKYPRFGEWEGEFKLNAQGPTFWIDGSTSPKSATIREKGMSTFAAHADKPFYSWNEILGENWVREYDTNRIGEASKDIYFDDKTFWMFSQKARTWLPESRENLTNELVVNRGLSRVVNPKSGAKHSEVEGALNFIRHNNRITGAASFAFYPKGLMDWNGGRYLNTHTRDVIGPAATAAWGPNGDFPWVSAFLDQFFSSPEQLPYFLAWLSRYYVSCYNRAPQSGQILFIAGPSNAGKTFLNRGIIGALMGGIAEAKKFLLGETNFNANLFDHAHWCVDDASVGSSAALHRYFSEMLKVIVANRDMESHGKFLKQSQVAWQGRCGITVNDDAESVRLLPRTDISNLDKIMLFRAGPRTVPFMSESDMQAMLTKELPHLARFLLDYVMPDHVRDDDPRFGVKSYHEPSLVSSANHTDSAFSEILDCWMTEHFTTREPKADVWEGTALQLRQQICMDPSMLDVMRSFDLDDVKRRLTKLSTGSLFDIEIYDDGQRMKFRIHRATHCPKHHVNGECPECTGPTKFQKP